MFQCQGSLWVDGGQQWEASAVAVSPFLLTTLVSGMQCRICFCTDFLLLLKAAVTVFFCFLFSNADVQVHVQSMTVFTYAVHLSVANNTCHPPCAITGLCIGTVHTVCVQLLCDTINSLLAFDSWEKMIVVIVSWDRAGSTHGMGSPDWHVSMVEIYLWKLLCRTPWTCGSEGKWLSR